MSNVVFICKEALKNRLTRTIGVRRMMAVVSFLRKCKGWIKRSIAFVFVKLRIFHPFYALLGKRVSRQQFEAFLQENGNYQRYINAALAKKLFISDEKSKIYIIKKFIDYAKETGNQELVPIFYEYMETLQGEDASYTAELKEVFNELIQQAVSNRDEVALDYFLSKIKQYDPVCEGYYRVLMSNEYDPSKIEKNQLQDLLEQAIKHDSIVAPKLHQQVK
ncbi:MAG: hypothetical protein KDK51_00365 [Deltaproteobacteria bacterium]|nr:hypothetical protein [Deltaproteobacteria bacterium]